MADEQEFDFYSAMLEKLDNFTPKIDMDDFRNRWPMSIEDYLIMKKERDDAERDNQLQLVRHTVSSLEVLAETATDKSFKAGMMVVINALRVALGLPKLEPEEIAQPAAVAKGRLIDPDANVERWLDLAGKALVRASADPDLDAAICYILDILASISRRIDK